MAQLKGGASTEKKGKKAHKNKLTSKKFKHYIVLGEEVKKARMCPRCGGGVFLSTHKDRLYCGRCHYTEFLNKDAV